MELSDTFVFKLLLAATGALGAFMTMAIEKPKSLWDAFTSVMSGLICAYFFAAPLTRYLPILDINDPDTISAMGLIVGMMGIFIVQTVVAFAKGNETPISKLLSKTLNSIDNNKHKNQNEHDI